MRLSVDEDGDIVLEEVYNPLVLRTNDGDELAICMRDDKIEMTVIGSTDWYRADMKSGVIRKFT